VLPVCLGVEWTLSCVSLEVSPLFHLRSGGGGYADSA
jgi:hypothetical protein